MCEREQICRSSENTRLPPASLGLDSGGGVGESGFFSECSGFPSPKNIILFDLVQVDLHPNSDS